MRYLPRAVLTTCAVALVACGGGGDSGYGTGPTTTPTPPTTPGTNPGGVATNTIDIGESSFDPENVAVPVGTTVTWMWNSCPGGSGSGYASCVSHNVTFDDGSHIASSTQDSGT